MRSAAGLAVRLGRPPGAVRGQSANLDVRPDAGTSGRDFPERCPM
jgi:hypothetical protein